MCKFKKAGLLLLREERNEPLPSIIGGHKAKMAELVRYCNQSYYEDAVQELIYQLLWLEKYYEQNEV